MKKVILIALSLFSFFTPCNAAGTYQVEILQVGKIESFDECYQAILKGFHDNGLIQGSDFALRRTIIDADAEAGIWEKMKILMKIKKTSGEIVDRKPNLVITMGTPATKYSKDKIIRAGIPLVFTCVAIPELVGCASKTQAGTGFTGVSIYMDPKDVIRIAQLALPKMKKLGVIHSDDDNAIAYTQETKQKAATLGMEVVSKQVGISQRITPAAEDLVSQGIDAFFVPIDKYYGIRHFESSRDLLKISLSRKIPCISSVEGNVKGSLLYVAPNFSVIGRLTADQASKILKENVKPETLPVGRQTDLNILVDLEASKKLGIELPLQILQVARKK